MELLELMYNQMDKDKTPQLQLVDNFFDDINYILEFTEQLEFLDINSFNFKTGETDAWPGLRTYSLDTQPPLHALINFYVRKRFFLPDLEPAYFFHKRGNEDNSTDWIHKDASKLALIVYLSETNLKSGTTFYDEEKNITTDIGFVQNRAILFNGQVPHKSKLNFGDKDNMRLTLNGFFYDKKKPI